MAQTAIPLGMPAAPPPPSGDDHLTEPLFPAPLETPTPYLGLSIADSDTAMRNLRRCGRELMEYADGYLTRKLWPTALLDQINGTIANAQSWITYAESGLYNYDADQPDVDPEVAILRTHRRRA